MTSGIINVLKPAGITSYQVLSKLKKVLHPQKIGHLGTLDPDAAGVLPVCINKATKLFDYYLKKDKVYRTVVIFGKETDTLDSAGEITKECQKEIFEVDLQNVLPSFIGKQSQLPPQYSAKKVNGKRAYELARIGVESELKPKDIEIYDIKLISKIQKNTFLLEISCSSGTYIRSIARDIAKKLGTVAYAGAIIRSKSGSFDIKNAVLVDDISENSIVSLKNILQDKQKVLVNDKFYDKITNGNSVQVNENNANDCVAYCKNELIGVGNVEKHLLTIQTNLWEKHD